MLTKSEVISALLVKKKKGIFLYNSCYLKRPSASLHHRKFTLPSLFYTCNDVALFSLKHLFSFSPLLEFNLITIIFNPARSLGIQLTEMRLAGKHYRYQRFYNLIRLLMPFRVKKSAPNGLFQAYNQPLAWSPVVTKNYPQVTRQVPVLPLRLKEQLTLCGWIRDKNSLTVPLPELGPLLNQGSILIAYELSISPLSHS